MTRSARTPATRAPHVSAAPFSVAASLVACAALGACAARPLPHPEPVPREAELLLAEAEALLRTGSMREASAEARLHLEQALALAPDWVAPHRSLQRLELADLCGPEAWARCEEALRSDPRDAAALYLSARIDPAAGAERYQAAIEADPGLAWGWHGLAWERRADGRIAEAARAERNALALARSGHERVFFSLALAEIWSGARRPDKARAVLELALLDRSLVAADRAELEVELCVRGLSGEGAAAEMADLDLALDLLGTRDLEGPQVLRLTEAGLSAPLGIPRSDRLRALDLALARRAGPARSEIRVQLLRDSGQSALGRALAERLASAGAGFGEDGGGDSPSPFERRARIAGGGAAAAIEEWLAGLPGEVVTEDRLPRSAPLRAVVLAARELGGAAQGDVVGRAPAEAVLAEALIEAGWFDEAEGLAEAMAVSDLERALALHDRAATGIELLARIGRTLEAIDRGADFPPRGAGPGPRPGSGTGSGTGPGAGEGHRGGRLRDLGDLLAELEPLFAHALPRIHPSGPAVARDFEASPRLSLPPVAEVVLPGPEFSSADQAAGRGRAGAPVPGLAAALARLGRFGLFGQYLGGGGPDGVVLRNVWNEERSGEHLGARWRGSVSWCESAEILSRPGRAGAQIGGAALHEGYWIDLDVVRDELAMWSSLAREFAVGEALDPPDHPGRAERALAARGPRISLERSPGASLSDERARRLPWLGEGRRVALAVLVERARAGRASGGVALDEVIELYAVHEEAHLCDRGRYLPLWRNLPGVLAFLARAGFSPMGVMRQLEYRAELVALCELPDPRLVLSHLLGVAEANGGETPHASAFETLGRDLVVELARALERDPGAFPELDRERHLAWQLHRLGPEELRHLGLALARREGLVD